MMMGIISRILMGLLLSGYVALAMSPGYSLLHEWQKWLSERMVQGSSIEVERTAAQRARLSTSVRNLGGLPGELTIGGSPASVIAELLGVKNGTSYRMVGTDASVSALDHVSTRSFGVIDGTSGWGIGVQNTVPEPQAPAVNPIVKWNDAATDIYFNCGPRIIRANLATGELSVVGDTGLVSDSEKLRRLGGELWTSGDAMLGISFDLSSTVSGIDQILFGSHKVWFPVSSTSMVAAIDADSLFPGFEIVKKDGPQGLEVEVTSNDKFDVMPVWSADRASIAFLRLEAATLRLIVARPDGYDEREVWSESRRRMYQSIRQRPVWSPDGQMLAFVSYDSASPRGRYWDGEDAAIYTARIDGSETRRITDAVSGPAWSSDGTRIAFAKPGIVTVTLDTGIADADLTSLIGDAVSEG